MSASSADHRMIPGSHERPSGPECQCGAEWDGWVDRCATTIPSRGSAVLCIKHDPIPDWLLRLWNLHGWPAEPFECVCAPADASSEQEAQR